MANAATVGALRVLLTADTAQFEKALTGATADAKKLATTMERDLAPSQAKVNSLVRAFLGSKEIGLAKNYAAAVQEIGGAAKLTAADQVRVNKTVQDALAHYKALGQQAPKALIDLANATKQAHAPTQQLGGGLDSLLGKARSLAGVFGVTLGGAAIGSFIKGTFDAADQIGDLSLKMGVSVEAAQRFQFAARQSGAEIEDVSRAIVMMNKNLAEGDKSTVGALEAAGLRFQDIRAKKPEEAFRAIADAIGRIPDPMLQAKVAMELFGKSGAEMLPLIREGSLEASDAIAVMSDETVKSLKDAQQAWENFGNALTVISAGGLAQILALVNALKDLTLHSKILSFLAMAAVGPANFAMLVNASSGMGGRGTAAAPSLKESLLNPALMSSHGPTFLTKDEQAAIDKAAKDATAAQKRLNESYRAFERERLTGLTDTQRQAKAFEARFLSERGLTGAAAWGAGLVSKTTNWASLLTDGPFSMPFSPAPSGTLPMKPTQWSKLLTGAIAPSDLMRGVPSPSLRTLLRGGVSSSVSMAPETIMQALMGGGSVSKSLGSLFGSQIGSSVTGTATNGIFGGGLGKMLQGSFLGNKLGGFVANLIPGAGALLGPLLSKAFGAIAGLGQNTTKGSREDFAKQMGFGSLADLHKQLQSMGAAGAALANTSLNVIGKKDKAATEKWMADVTKFLDTVPKKFAALTSAVEAFGGVAPKAVRPLIDSLLKTGTLTDDMRAQLTGLMGKPTWQAALDTANALGVDPRMLGAGFNQARISSNAFTLQHQIEQLEEFNANVMDFLPGVGDELSALALDAIKTGAALPKTLEPYLRQLDAMGLLLDENGDKIDMGALSFKELEDESLKAIKDVLEDIRDLLAGKLPDAARKFSDALGGIRPPTFGDDQRIHLQMPDTSDWGAYGGASLAGAESGGAGDLTVNMVVDGEVLTKAVIRHAPNLLERWGGAN